MKSSWFVVIGAAMLLGLGLAWWLGEPGTQGPVITSSAPAPESMPESLVNPTGAAQPFAEPVPQPLESAQARIARRLVQTPAFPAARADDAPTTDERDITPDNIEQLTRDNLDHALTGDLDSGYFVTRSRMACERFADTPEGLDRSISRVERRVRNAQANSRKLPDRPEYGQPWSFTDDMEANRAHMKRWYSACERIRDMFSPDLRLQLENMALNGDVMARYLYATWPVEVLDGGEAFESQFRWEELAREFSRANMEMGEAAGLLAFGQSYMSGWFTARNGDLALSFGVAALNCGFETISIRSYLASSIERLTSSQNPADLQRLQFIIDESDHLSRFCAF